MIKLEFDGQDPTALKHLGQALVNMANEINGITVKQRETIVTGGTYEQQIVIDQAKPDSEATVKANVTVENGEVTSIVESNPKYDANGLPWDERIHSGGKTRNADDTWQKRKHNKKDFPSKDDWSTYIAEVETELQALMSIPVVEPEHPSDEEMDKLLTTTLADVQADAPPPPPPLVDDVPKSESTNQDAPPPPPPEVTSVADAGNTPEDVEVSVKFGDITKFITGTIVKNGVRSMSQVTAAITAEYGVAFPLLAKNPKLWPQVMAFLEKMNNEADTK